MASDTDKKDTGLCPGFSKRFNYFLDQAGYPSLNQGRLTAFSDDVKLSVSGVRKWIVEDNPPRGPKLVEVCEMVSRMKLSKRYNPRRIACWLEYGEEIMPNPFSSGKSIRNDHAIMGSIYVLAHNAAKKLKIDLNNMDSKLLDEFYDQIMDDVVTNKLAEPDKQLISSLLVLAEKKQKAKKQVQ